MNEFKVLSAVRSYLLNKSFVSHIHLALPPHALFPLILIDPLEMWSPHPFRENDKRHGIFARVKFRVGIYSHMPGLEEAANLSSKTRNYLDGITISIEAEMKKEWTATFRFLSCVPEMPGNLKNNDSTRLIQNHYDCIVRG